MRVTLTHRHDIMFNKEKRKREREKRGRSGHITKKEALGLFVQ